MSAITETLNAIANQNVTKRTQVDKTPEYKKTVAYIRGYLAAALDTDAGGKPRAVKNPYNERNIASADWQLFNIGADDYYYERSRLHLNERSPDNNFVPDYSQHFKAPSAHTRHVRKEKPRRTLAYWLNLAKKHTH